MLDFLPDCATQALKKTNPAELREIRLRCGNGLFVNECGAPRIIPYGGGARVSERDLEKMMVILTEHSIYAHAETLKNGFITTRDGERVGVCGTAVLEGGAVRMLKNVTSVCIRIPHEIRGAANYLVNSIFNSGLVSLLVVSPPGLGKTTLIRDLVRSLSDKFSANILVVDERMELGANMRFDLGRTTDVLSGAPKEYGLEVGVRTLCPEVIAVDEITDEEQALGIVKAGLSGVKVIASAHGGSLYDVKRKKIFKAIFENGVFDYAVVLKRVGQAGEIIKLT